MVARSTVFNCAVGPCISLPPSPRVLCAAAARLTPFTCIACREFSMRGLLPFPECHVRRESRVGGTRELPTGNPGTHGDSSGRACGS